MTDETPTTAPAAESEAAHATADAPAELFNRLELDEFSRDDSQAGKAIGRLLAIFFLYTVVAMTFAGVWTLSQMGD